MRHTNDDRNETKRAMDAGITEAEPRENHEKEIGNPAVPFELFVEQEITDAHQDGDTAKTDERVNSEA